MRSKIRFIISSLALIGLSLNTSQVFATAVPLSFTGVVTGSTYNGVVNSYLGTVVTGVYYVDVSQATSTGAGLLYDFASATALYGAANQTLVQDNIAPFYSTPSYLFVSQGAANVGSASISYGGGWYSLNESSTTGTFGGTYSTSSITINASNPSALPYNQDGSPVAAYSSAGNGSYGSYYSNTNTGNSFSISYNITSFGTYGTVVSSVPEPTELLLSITGFGLISFLARRRKSNSSNLPA